MFKYSHMLKKIKSKKGFYGRMSDAELSSMTPKLKYELKTRNDEKRMNRLNISIAFVIAAAESLIFAIGFGEGGLLKDYSLFYVTLTAAIWTAATIFISFMAKIITDNFIGNGISLILFINIVCGFPSDAETVKSAFLDGYNGIDLIVRIIIIIVIIFAVFYAAYIIQVTERRLPVTYSGKLSADISGKRLNCFLRDSIAKYNKILYIYICSLILIRH